MRVQPNIRFWLVGVFATWCVETFAQETVPETGRVVITVEGNASVLLYTRDGGHLTIGPRSRVSVASTVANSIRLAPAHDLTIGQAKDSQASPTGTVRIETYGEAQVVLYTLDGGHIAVGRNTHLVVPALSPPRPPDSARRHSPEAEPTESSGRLVGTITSVDHEQNLIEFNIGRRHGLHENYLLAVDRGYGRVKVTRVRESSAIARCLDARTSERLSVGDPIVLVRNQPYLGWLPYRDSSQEHELAASALTGRVTTDRSRLTSVPRP